MAQGTTECSGLQNSIKKPAVAAACVSYVAGIRETELMGLAGASIGQGCLRGSPIPGQLYAGSSHSGSSILHSTYR